MFFCCGFHALRRIITICIVSPPEHRAPFGVNGAEVEWLQEEEEGQQRRVSLSLWWQLNHGQGVNHHHLWLHISCK